MINFIAFSNRPIEVIKKFSLILLVKNIDLYFKKMQIFPTLKTPKQNDHKSII